MRVSGWNHRVDEVETLKRRGSAHRRALGHARSRRRPASRHRAARHRATASAAGECPRWHRPRGARPASMGRLPRTRDDRLVGLGTDRADDARRDDGAVEGRGRAWCVVTTRGRDVALKVIPDTLALDPDRVARVKREAQVLLGPWRPADRQCAVRDEVDEDQCGHRDPLSRVSCTTKCRSVPVLVPAPMKSPAPLPPIRNV